MKLNIISLLLLLIATCSWAQDKDTSASDEKQRIPIKPIIVEGELTGVPDGTPVQFAFRAKKSQLYKNGNKTLVDTIIDLQMDDQPLIIKKNANGVDVCASCNQPVAKINMNSNGKEYLNTSTVNTNRAKILNKSVNFTQPINMKSKNNGDKNSKSNLGESKLPDIIPNIYQK